MSRSHYSDDIDNWQLIKWRGAVNSALRGARGQAFFKEMLAAMDAMPVKRLVAHELVEPENIPCSHWGMFETESVCAIGAVGKARGIDMSSIDPEDADTVAGKFNIAHALACEIVYMNDEWGSYKETPEARFIRMRKWVESNILANPQPRIASVGDEHLRWADDGGANIEPSQDPEIT
ncbi:hypothetical protein [Bradyrhizobium genosp. L]|uniref:hypothetical protein n=1 Tax=Bradyrhizobium genosp. L TaxID=83637 RepID=UPI001AED7E6F|nr:hypothetical protein [Bradyrhizobium genosp. L]